MWHRLVQLLNDFRKRWIRYGSTEQEIRDWFSSHGYEGRTAELSDLVLHAVQRPGWVQIFGFQARVKNHHENWVHAYGTLRSDERYGEPQIFVSQNVEERDQTMDSWSDGLIVRPSRR